MVVLEVHLMAFLEVHWFLGFSPRFEESPDAHGPQIPGYVGRPCEICDGLGAPEDLPRLWTLQDIEQFPDSSPLIKAYICKASWTVGHHCLYGYNPRFPQNGITICSH